MIIKREKHTIDASGKVLGRLATEVAKLLMGKHKVSFVPYLDMGDYVTVINASKVKFSGKKLAQKRYISHSGYPGGLRVQKLNELMGKRPEYVIEHAVKGMLPRTKLGSQMIKKLKILKTGSAEGETKEKS